jgi:hypothetical protein
MRTARKLAAVIGVVTIALAVVATDVADAATKPKSCTLLKPSQMSKVLGDEVTGPDITGTSGTACSFNIGGGLGEPGGGLVIVTYYSGSVAKARRAAVRLSGRHTDARTSRTSTVFTVTPAGASGMGGFPISNMLATLRASSSVSNTTTATPRPFCGASQ